MKRTRRTWKVTSRGQVTIPLELREKYNLSENSLVEFLDVDDGILIRPLGSVLDFVGILADSTTPLEAKRVLDDMRAEGEEAGD